VVEGDLELGDGRTLHWYDTGAPVGVDDPLVVYWHHGTPNIGAPPEPLFAVGDRLGVRWISHDRPGYGWSTPLPDRSFASVAGDAAAVADALGVQRFAAMGHSSGGPHALACAALLPNRVVAVVSASGLAPYHRFRADGLDWYAGMADDGSLRAAVAGRAAKEAYERAAPEGMPGFTAADWGMLEGDWSWFGEVVGSAVANGPGPLIDDDLVNVAPWGFDVGDVPAPVLVLHGGADRVVPAAHGEWLAAHLPDAELWLRPDDGHISVLAAAPDALAWLRGTQRCHSPA
jgi:pimeloyl-ACP methyl ester carboxylesterase